MASAVASMRTDFAPIGDIDTTRELARFSVSTGFADLPSEVVRQTRRLVADTVGLGLGAGGEPDVSMLVDYATELGGHEQATVWSRRKRLNVIGATMANAQASGLFDMDDTYLSDALAYHAGPQTIAAALAVGEWLESPGPDFMAAVAVGYEVSLRFMLALGKTYHRQRWYSVAGGGPIAAAVASGKLLGLDEQQMVYAIGLSVVQAGGLIEGLGTMSSAFQYARTSAAGVTAAMLAKRGFTTANDILTGRFGVHQVYHSERDLRWLTDDLGTHWEMLNTGFKPYACGINMHALISGLIGIHDDHAPDIGSVEEIGLHVNPHVLVPTGMKQPSSGRQGKFSVYYTAAVALVDGAVEPQQYSDERFADPLLSALAEKVRVFPEDGRRRDEASVYVRMKDGTTFERYVAHAPGTIRWPMSDETLLAKCRRFAISALGVQQADRFMAALADIERSDDVGDLARLTAPGHA